MITRFFAVLLFTISVSAQDRALLSLPQGGNPLASTEEKLFPLPSRFFQAKDTTSRTGVRSSYPAKAVSGPRSLLPVDFSAFNSADGHSPSAPLLVHFGIDVADEFLDDQSSFERSLEAGAPIALFNLDSGERIPVMTEMDRNLRKQKHRGRHPLIIRPMSPMSMGCRHLAVLTTALRDTDGHKIMPPPGFLALRDRITTDHSALEESRASYEDYFKFLADKGYPRDGLLLAFDFMVSSKQHVLGGILSMRDQALSHASENKIGYRIDRVLHNPNENVAIQVEGSFEVPSFLNRANAIERRADGSAILQDDHLHCPFTMIVPPQINEGKPLPLVLFDHGIFGRGRDYLIGRRGIHLTQPLARRGGSVLIATDFIGLCRDDRTLVLSQIGVNPNRVHVITDRLQQSLINNLLLVELALGDLNRDERIGLNGQPLLNPQRVHYYGVSLGGCQGVSLTALSSRISRAFLAVPGGAWSTMLSRSIVYRPLKILIDRMHPDPLLQQTFLTLIQSRFDGCDAVNLGTLLYKNRLADAPKDRRIMLLEAIGDCQVPNIATRIVARAIGVSQLVPMIEPVFGLEPVTGPTKIPVLAQISMPERLAKYRPPDENILPERDNRTHSDAILLEPAIKQLMDVLSRGVADN